MQSKEQAEEAVAVVGAVVVAMAAAWEPGGLRRFVQEQDGETGW